MTASGLRRVLLRRWYLVIVGLVIAAGLTFAATIAVPVEHEADAAVLLLPPSDPSKNPYSALSGYSPFADVFARAVMDTSSVVELKAAGVTDPFTVARDLTTSAPIIRVTVTSPDPDRAIAQMQIVLNSIPRELVAIQQNEQVPQGSMFTSKVITQDEHPSAIRKSQTRAMIAAGALGILIMVWGTVWIDSLLSRRGDKGRSRHRVERGDPDRGEAAQHSESPHHSEPPHHGEAPHHGETAQQGETDQHGEIPQQGETDQHGETREPAAPRRRASPAEAPPARRRPRSAADDHAAEDAPAPARQPSPAKDPSAPRRRRSAAKDDAAEARLSRSAGDDDIDENAFPDGPAPALSLTANGSAGPRRSIERAHVAAEPRPGGRRRAQGGRV